MKRCIQCYRVVANKDDQCPRCHEDTAEWNRDQYGSKNPMYGKHLTDQAKAAIGERNRGPNNGLWKGEKVGYAGVHAWVKTHLARPKLCQKCNKVAPHDLANVTGVYSRNSANWMYLCRKCHMESDGRMRNLILARQKRIGFSWSCIKCEKTFRGKNNRHDLSWGYICVRCWQVTKIKTCEEVTRR